MSYYVNKLNQKIAYKYYRGGSPGIIFVHGLNSDMEGLKAKSIEKYAKKNKLSFLRFDCRGHGKSHGNFEDFTISDWKNDLIDMIDNIACIDPINEPNRCKVIENSFEPFSVAFG